MAKLYFEQVMDDLATLITNNWGGSSGVLPEILTEWDEKILTYNKKDSYILLSTTPEITNIFSHMEGAGSYRWYHKVPVEIDIRTYTKDVRSLKTRFAQVYNNVETILKDNIRFVVGGNTYVRITLLSASPDYTRRQTKRIVRHIEVDKVE